MHASEHELVISAVDLIAELVIAIGFLVLIIGFHGWSLVRASRRFTARMIRMTAHSPVWRINLLMAETIAALVLMHLVEGVIWAIPVYGFGMTKTAHTAYSYVLQAYTTLGEAGVTLPERYRLVSPMIAISGLFTFGWTASALVYVMNQVLRLHAMRTHRGSAQDAGPFGT